MAGETLTLINADLREPLNRLETRVYSELGRNAIGIFFGSRVTSEDTHYGDTFSQVLQSAFAGPHEDPALCDFSGEHYIYSGKIRTGLRLRQADGDNDLYSNIQLGYLADGWEIISGYTSAKEIDIAEFAEAALHHFAALNVLLRQMVEYHDGEEGIDRPPVIYNVPNNDLELAADIDDRAMLQRLRSEATTHFEKFAGIDGIVEELLDMIVLGNAVTRHEFDQVGRIPACLLSGESGVGKTELARAVATALDARLEYISFDKVQGIYVGEWAKKISSIFDAAFKSDDGNVVILFDELDGLTTTGNPHSTGNVMAVMKQKLEELARYNHVFVVATSNSLEGLDPAVIADKRIPLKLHIPLPTESELEEIYARVLGINTAVTLHEVTLDDEAVIAALDASRFNVMELARASEGFSPGDVITLIDRAKQKLVLRMGRSAGDLDQKALLKAIDHARKHRPQAL